MAIGIADLWVFSGRAASGSLADSVPSGREGCWRAGDPFRSTGATGSATSSSIVASALPFIAASFGEIAQLNWIISTFDPPTATAVSLPSWVRMDGTYRRSCWLLMILIIAVDSAIGTYALADTFPAVCHRKFID